MFGSVPLGSEYTSDGMAFTKLRSEIIDLYTTVLPFEYLFYEQVINHRKNVGSNEASVLMLVGLRAIILNVGHELRCRSVKDVPIDAWRTDFCGRGEVGLIKRAARNAKAKSTDPLKAATMERCRQLGMKPKNDNEGDALGILTYSLLVHGIKPPWLESEVLRPPLGGDQ